MQKVDVGSNGQMAVISLHPCYYSSNRRLSAELFWSPRHPTDHFSNGFQILNGQGCICTCHVSISPHCKKTAHIGHYTLQNFISIIPSKNLNQRKRNLRSRVDLDFACFCQKLGSGVFHVCVRFSILQPATKSRSIGNSEIMLGFIQTNCYIGTCNSDKLNF